MPIIPTPVISNYAMGVNTYDTNHNGLVDTVKAFNFQSLTSVPTCFIPCAHTHSINDITGLGLALANVVTTSTLTSLLAPNYYTQSQINTALNGKANVVHFHDDRYVQIANFGTYYTGTGVAIDVALATAGTLTHLHDNRYYTKTYIDNLFNQPNAGFTNDTRYYTKPEVDAIAASKANVLHVHDDRYYLKAQVDGKIARQSSGIYFFTPSAGLTTWNIAHNLNTYPAVTVVDQTGKVVTPQSVQYIDWNNITVIFSSAFAGKAYLNYITSATNGIYSFTPTPSNQWVLVHNLNTYPNVTVVDTTGTVVLAQTIYTDANTITINFGSTFTGSVYLN